MKNEKKEIKEKVVGYIRAGNNYSQTKKLLEAENINYPNLSKTFYKWSEEIHPEDLRGKTLEAMKETRETKKQPLLPTPKAWNKGKQKEADECVFSDAINEALFYFIPCPQQGLKIEDVKQINLGGGIVGVVTYYTNINLNHPVIVLLTRGILMVLKVRQMCYLMQDKYNEIKAKARSSLPGQGSISSKQ